MVDKSDSVSGTKEISISSSENSLVENPRGNINSYILPIFAAIFIFFGTINLTGAITVGVKFFFTANALLNTPFQNKILFISLIIQSIAFYIFGILNIIGAVYNGKMISKNKEIVCQKEDFKKKYEEMVHQQEEQNKRLQSLEKMIPDDIDDYLGE